MRNEARPKRAEIRIQKLPLAEFVAIRAAARRAGLTPAQFCRQVVRAAVLRAGRGRTD